MTLEQGIELAQFAKSNGYALAAENGRVQFQIIDSDGNVEIEITDWISYAEAVELMQ